MTCSVGEGVAAALVCLLPPDGAAQETETLENEML
jgi:hypothetical protein